MHKNSIFAIWITIQKCRMDFPEQYIKKKRLISRQHDTHTHTHTHTLIIIYFYILHFFLLLLIKENKWSKEIDCRLIPMLKSRMQFFYRYNRMYLVEFCVSIRYNRKYINIMTFVIDFFIAGEGKQHLGMSFVATNKFIHVPMHTHTHTHNEN